MQFHDEEGSPNGAAEANQDYRRILDFKPCLAGEALPLAA
jgi:hypothetical protein